jgi:hypothetical protein
MSTPESSKRPSSACPTLLGEDVSAVVVARPGVALDPDELKAWVKKRVAAYKYPRQVALVAELPKSATGKILKRSIDLGLLLEGVTGAPRPDPAEHEVGETPASE